MQHRIPDLEMRLQEGTLGYLEEQVFLELIEENLIEGRLDLAAAASEHALGQHPFSVDLMCSRAAVLLEQELPEEALALLGQAASISPGTVDVILLQVETLIEMGRAGEAEILLAPYLASGEDLDLADAWYFQGIIEEQRDNWTEMHRCLETAVRYNPNFQEALERLWLCTEILGNHSEAAAFYETILDKEPYSWQVWFNLGHARSCMEDLRGAAEAFDYACIINENFEFAWRDLGEVYMQLGETAKAVECLQTALDKTGLRDPELLIRLGEALERHGQKTRAAQMFREAISIDRRQDEAHFRLGCLLVTEDRLKAGIGHLKRAISLQGDREEYHVALAEAWFRSGDMPRAEECLLQAIEMAPEQSEYWLQYASYLLEEGNPGAALDNLETAITLQRSARLDYARIVCLFRLGMRQEACQLLCLQLSEDFDAHAVLFDLAPELSSDPDVISLVRAFRTDP